MFRNIYSTFIKSSFLSQNCGQKLLTRTNTSSTGRPLIEKGMNKVILMGRCGNDAQLRGNETNSVVMFSLATHTHYKSRETDEFQQKTDWHRISVFRDRLKVKSLEFAKKGSRLLVQGRISYGELTDANGNSHQTTSIIADDIIFLSQSRADSESETDVIKA